VHRLTALAIAFSLTAQDPLETRAIRIARQIPASKLDPGLPNQPLEKWLAKAIGPAIKWEANDCGEQSGDPAVDRGRDFPLCVDAIATLPGGRLAIVTIAMGTFKNGIARAPKLLRVNLGTIEHFDPVAKLSDLPARIQSERQ